MSYLSSVLSDTLTVLGITQTELAKRAGITQAQANRACRGTVAVKADTIHAIARVIPAEHRGAVVAAWLRDQIDSDLLDYVLLATSRPVVNETPTQALPAHWSTETRDLAVWVGDEAERNTAVLDMLRGLKKIAGGR